MTKTVYKLIQGEYTERLQYTNNAIELLVCERNCPYPSNYHEIQ